MKQRNKRLIQFISLLIFFLFALAASVVVRWISELPNRLVDGDVRLNREVTRSKNLIEEGSFFNPELARAFNVFTQKAISQDSFVKGKGLALSEEDIVLGELRRNDCERPFCFQSRLAFGEIPGSLWKGLIGIEDLRFLNHQGVDPISIVRAFWADLKAMSFVQGGSTLTMQLVKNLFLTQDKAIKRKVKEMVLALYIEFTYSKEEILQTYFNETQWGALQGIRIKGIYAASAFYFQNRPEQLNGYEVAILISLLKGPYFYHPIKKTERLKGRVATVVKKLKSLDLVYFDYIWTEQDWSNWVRRLEDLEKTQVYRNLILSMEDRDNQYLSEFQSFVMVNGIHHSRVVNEKKVKDKDIAVKIFAGDVYCKEGCHFYGFYSKIERDLEQGIYKERQQTGSIFKPMIYHLYTENGLSLNDLVSTKKITLNLLSGPWSPGEASRIDEDEILIREALMRSRNRPTIRLANEVGFENIEMGLEPYLGEYLKRPLGEYPAQLIGAIELSVSEVWKAYQKFLSQHCPKEEIVNPVISTLSSPRVSTVRRVVDRRLADHRFFGKTGTTNGGQDAWYIGFDGSQLIVTWMGLEGDRTDQKPNLSGAGAAFRIYQYFKLNQGKRLRELHCVDEA